MNADVRALIRLIVIYLVSQIALLIPTITVHVVAITCMWTSFGLDGAFLLIGGLILWSMI